MLQNSYINVSLTLVRPNNETFTVLYEAESTFFLLHYKKKKSCVSDSAASVAVQLFWIA